MSSSGNSMACSSVDVFVEPIGNATLQPPFYMFALAAGGTPTVSLLGTNLNNLTWVVNQPLSWLQFTKLISIGINNKRTCLARLKPAALGAARRGWCTTIQSHHVRAQIAVITNVTMPNGDDVFTYINRADPDLQLIAPGGGRWGHLWSIHTDLPTLIVLG
ncbi:hypothetical protein BD779DRAFT_1469912 [Infundibulicybe gibba]|nr:hypothetical protein BD779DRAFT_1469912 [Infundibulicybe gibba]